MRLSRITVLLILVLGFCNARAYGQVTATWTDTSGNYSTAANWSTLTVPNNGGGTTYDVVINGTGADTITFDANGTVINSLTLGTGETFQDNGSSPTLTTGSLTNRGTINWGNGASLTLDITAGNGTIMNSGAINLASSTLRIIDGGNGNTATLSGGGTVNLTGGTIVGSFGDETLINSDNTIQGAGGPFGIRNLVNDAGGTINANVSGQTLDLSQLGLTNTGGKLEASNGGTLMLAFTGRIDNKNGTIEANGAGSVVQLTNGADILGGTLTSTAGGSIKILGNDLITLDGSTQGPLTLSTGTTYAGIPSTTTQVLGTIVNNGNMLFTSGAGNDSILQIAGNTTLQGTGTVTLAGGIINANGGSYTLTNQITIQGAGVIGELIGAGGLDIVNAGLIDANASGQTLTLKPTSLQNAGILQVESGSTMSLDIASGFATNTRIVNVKNGGTMSFASGTTYIQNAGATIIENGGLFVANSFIANGGTVTVNGLLDPTAVEINSGAALRGTGTIVGNIAMAGRLTPGSLFDPGILTVIGNYEQLDSGIFRELLASSSSSGLLNVSGIVALDPDSLLQIMLIDGFNPLGDTFAIMDYSSLVGQFANGWSFVEDGFLWDVSYGQNEIDVTAVRTVHAPEPSSLLLLGAGLLGLCVMARRKSRGNAVNQF